MERDFPPFEIIDHTADVGIIAYGRDYRELLENAALGMFSLMADLLTVSPKERREVRAESPIADEELLLLKWLKELHYLRETEKFIPCRAEVTELNLNEVVGLIDGEKIHEGITLLHHIKAVTHHLIRIERENGFLKAQVIFDV
ncbi:MAG: archease [Armatimonadetes bacterium]|nr:archease [Armatimonadota bacterium]MDW8029503.1 archease [Armatimonadota bacterium]